MTPFRAEGGGIDVALRPEEQLLLSQLIGLLGSVGASPGDPAADRLDPDAFRDDAAASREFRRLTESELATARGEDRGSFERTRAGNRLDISEAEAWVRVLGDARLALAARQGVVEDDAGWEHEVDANPELGIVAYLGYLQGALVEALMDLEVTA